MIPHRNAICISDCYVAQLLCHLQKFALLIYTHLKLIFGNWFPFDIPWRLIVSSHCTLSFGSNHAVAQVSMKTHDVKTI